MIPLTEWSRRRPPPPVFPAFEEITRAEADESGMLECEGLVSELINNVQLNVACEANASLEAKCAAARQETVSELDAMVEEKARRIHDELMQHFNAALKPWLGRQIEETALEAFCNAVAQAVGDELSQEIAVEAPQALQDKLSERFGADSIRAQVSDSPDEELHAKVGSTRISTEISVWQARLNSVLP